MLWTASSRKVLNMGKVCAFTQSSPVQSHPGICSPLKHFCPMILFVDSEGPDQTTRMRRLIWGFAVHIFLKARFCMAQPKCNQ